MEWKISTEPVVYEEAIAFMEARVQAIETGMAEECVWLLEHPSLYTAGTSAIETDLLDSSNLPVYKTGRGGQYTWHGPGQRVAYVMLNLKKRTPDVRLFVQQLEQWIIATLATFGVRGEVREGRVGVWVRSPHPNPLPQAGEGKEKPSPACGRGLGEGPTEAKIAALGIRLRRWVSYHGIAINVNPDLSYYKGIVPCGIKEFGVTSLSALGLSVEMEEVDRELKKTFEEIFKPSATA